MFDYVMVLGLDEPEDVPDSGTDADGHQAAVGTWGAKKDIIRGLGTAYGVSARPLCSCCCDWFAIATIGRTSTFCLINCIPLVSEESGQGGTDDVPLPATPEAPLEPDAPPNPVTPIDLAQLMQSAI